MREALKPRPLRSFSADPHLEVDAAELQQRRCADQRLEPLLLDEPADCQYDGGVQLLFGRSGSRQVHPVVDAVHGSRVADELPQIRRGFLRTRQDGFRLARFRAEFFRRRDPDVLRMCGEREVNTRETRGETSVGTRLMNEMDVERRRPEPQDLVCEDRRTRERGPRKVWSPQDVAKCIEIRVPTPKEERRVCGPSGRSLTPGRSLEQIFDGRAQLARGLQLDDLLRASQGDDVQSEAATLEVEQLLQDEGLGEAWEAVEENEQVDRPTSSRLEARDAAQVHQAICLRARQHAGLQRATHPTGSAAVYSPTTAREVKRL